jgi:hypothetical protein
MSDKKTQRNPKGHEIPVPKRKGVAAIFDKVARAPKRSTPKRCPTK